MIKYRIYFPSNLGKKRYLVLREGDKKYLNHGWTREEERATIMDKIQVDCWFFPSLGYSIDDDIIEILNVQEI